MREPALALPLPRRAAELEQEVTRPMAGSVVALGVLAVLLALVLAVLLACQPSVPMPVSPPPDVWTTQPQPGERGPSPSPVSPGHTPGRPVLPGPQPSESGSGGGPGAA